MNQPVEAIRWQGNYLSLLDQRILPHEQLWRDYHSAAEVAEAIKEMVVRGAPAIGITAAYGYALDALAQRDLNAAFKVLAASRPTAVNLFWALERMQAQQNASAQDLLQEAIKIHQEDLAANQAMGILGTALLPEQARLYTHCNTGALATGGHGTALGVIRTAFAQGKVQHVYAGETRPWLQGSRLTAWELQQERIPATLVGDSAAAQLFKREKIDWVIVGADRIAANGDTANKIGTYSLAVLAKYHGVKVMVVAPSTSFDLTLSSGQQIEIEQRPTYEVTEFKGQPVAPLGFNALNPSFDVTPAELIDAIVTEQGVILKPSTEHVAKVLAAHD